MTDLAERTAGPTWPEAPPVPPAAAASTVVALRRPAPSRLLDTDVVALLTAFVVAVVGTWATHGGVSDLGAGGDAAWTSLARLSGLLVSSAGLLGLVLVARPRSLERRWGIDRLFIWHRYLGEGMAVLLAAHVATSVVAWSFGLGVTDAVIELTGRTPHMAAATVGALLIGVVTVTSLRSVRHQLAYETWYALHLTAYLGLALAFGHTIALGTDLATDAVARWAWIAVHVVVLAGLLWGRWGRMLASVARPLRVTSVEPVGGGTVALRLGGRNLRHVAADAGQVFLLRPLRRHLWWQSHPYSLSAAPTTDGLRFSIKPRGDASAATTELPVGARVAVEGPYGVITPDALAGHRVVMIVGGIGVAPALSLLERLDAASAPVVLYRAHATADLVHLDELRRRTGERGGAVHVLVGPTARLAVRDPFAAAELRAVVPDVAQRTAVVCGPQRLLHAARRGLRAAGVPRDRIHIERPWW